MKSYVSNITDPYFNRKGNEEQIIKKLVHIDPKDLPKLNIVSRILATKLSLSIEQRYNMELCLNKFCLDLKNLVGED